MPPLQSVGLVPHGLNGTGAAANGNPLKPLQRAVKARQCDLCGIIILNIFQ